MTKPKGWRQEPARHALAAKGVSTKRVVRHATKTTPRPAGYIPIDGKFQYAVDHGSIISMVMKDKQGKTQEYFGDHRMMLEALDNLKKDAPIRVNWKSDWDWYLERFD